MKTSTLVMLCFVLAVTAHARPEHPGRGGMMKRLARELNLTEAQKKQIGEIRKKHKDGLKSARQEGRAIREELMTAMQSPKKGPEYRAELTAKFKKAQELREKMAGARFEMALDIREILTPEQLAKFKGAIAGLGGSRGRGRGAHGPSPDPEDDNDKPDRDD